MDAASEHPLVNNNDQILASSDAESSGHVSDNEVDIDSKVSRQGVRTIILSIIQSVWFAYYIECNLYKQGESPKICIWNNWTQLFILWKNVSNKK